MNFGKSVNILCVNIDRVSFLKDRDFVFNETFFQSDCKFFIKRNFNEIEIG